MSVEVNAGSRTADEVGHQVGRYSMAGALTDRYPSTPSPFSATDAEYIEGWYNPYRRHKGLGQK